MNRPWMVLAGSLAFVVGGGYAAVDGDGRDIRVAGVVGVLFFGLGAVLAARQLRGPRPPDPAVSRR
ncbi:MAG TPA: hypothetical protein VL738_29060 [Dactylosporangium sp.]|nr:hypothetical protein [Dactylosporangium sp.]